MLRPNACKSFVMLNRENSTDIVFGFRYPRSAALDMSRARHSYLDVGNSWKALNPITIAA